MSMLLPELASFLPEMRFPPLHSPASLESRPSTSRPTFDKFNKLESTFNDFYPDFNLLVSGRFCPPDRCSGRKRKVENLDAVEQHVEKLFLLTMKLSSLHVVLRDMDVYQMVVLQAMLPHLASLDCSSTVEKRRIINLMETVGRQRVQLPDHTLVAVILCYALEYLHTKLTVFVSSSIRCLCDLTHLPLSLIRSLARTEAEYQSLVEKVHAAGSFIRSSEMYKEVQDQISFGLLSSDCWKGDWKGKFDKLVQFVSTPLRTFIIANHEIFTPKLSAVVQVFPASRILEELGSPFRGSSIAAKPADLLGYIDRFVTTVTPHSNLMMNFFYSTFTWDLVWEEAVTATLAADDDRSTLFWALNAYQLVTLFDPSNVVARLNAASIRLRMASDTSQYYQYSRAIYDCTAVLYYGPPNFKAYYRRAYALVELKMYDEAILDIDQALLIESGNSVALCVLEAAQEGIRARELEI